MSIDPAAAVVAVERFAALFAARDVAHDVGPSLTCDEADALASVLDVVDRGAARAFIEAHGDADDVGDLHHRVTRVLTRADCAPSAATIAALAAAGIEHEPIDVDATPEISALAHALGYQGTPIVIGPYAFDHWHGHRPCHIERLAASIADATGE